MKKKYTLLLKNVGLFTIGSFGAKVISFLMIPLYTAVLSTSNYGTVDLLQSTSQLLIPIFLLSIQDATLRYCMDPNYEKSDVISTTFKVIIQGSLVLLVGLGILKNIGILNFSSAYLSFLFFSFVLGALNNCLNLYLKAKNEASIIVVSGMICAFTTCLSNVLFLVILKCGVIGYMGSNTIGLFLQAICQFFGGKVYKDLHYKKYKDLSKPMIKYSVPLIANSVAWWVNSASDRYILTWICGVAINGIYSVSYKIPTILTTFQSIFYNAWSISAIAEFDEKDEDGFIGNNYFFYSFISILSCAGLILINIPIAKLLYSGDFLIAWKSVPFLLVGTVFNGISQFEGSLFAAVRRTKTVSLTTILGAVLNTVCNLIFIFFWGAVGAAFATMIGYCLTWIMRTIFLQDFVHMKVDWMNHFLAIVLLVLEAVLATLNVLYVFQVFFVIMIIILHRRCIKQFRNMVKRSIYK